MEYVCVCVCMPIHVCSLRRSDQRGGLESGCEGPWMCQDKEGDFFSKVRWWPSTWWGWHQADCRLNLAGFSGALVKDSFPGCTPLPCVPSPPASRIFICCYLGRGPDMFCKSPLGDSDVPQSLGVHTVDEESLRIVNTESWDPVLCPGGLPCWLSLLTSQGVACPCPEPLLRASCPHPALCTTGWYWGASAWCSACTRLCLDLPSWWVGWGFDGAEWVCIPFDHDRVASPSQPQVPGLVAGGNYT